MQRQQVRLQKNSPIGMTHWGLGWVLQNLGGHKVIGHDGGTIGQYSFLRVSPQKRFAVALLTNGGDAMSLYKDMSSIFSAEIRRSEPELPPADAALRIEPSRYVGRYENIQSVLSIDEHRGGLRASTLPKAAVFGTPLKDLPLAFVDRETAVLATGNPQMDRMSLLFSDQAEGRYGYVQVGMRQFRRTA
jgi:hypothetical protein